MATATTSLTAAVDLLTELATPGIAQAAAEQAFNDYIHRNDITPDPMHDLTAEQRGTALLVGFAFIDAARLHPTAAACPDLGQAADYAAQAVRNALHNRRQEPTMTTSPGDNDLKCDGDCGFYFNPGSLVAIDGKVYCQNEPAVQDALRPARDFLAALHADR